MKSAFRHPLRSLRHKGWVWSRALRARWDPAPGRRWLFSARQDWADGIRRSFRSSRHEIAFGALEPDAIRSHDAVVPLTIGDVRLLANQPWLAAHSLIPIPTSATVELCDDKLALNLALQSAGFADHVPPMGAASRPPFMVKKRNDEHGRSCLIVDASDSAHVLNRHGAVELVQTFVPGRIEHALHVLFRHGRIEWCLNIEYLYRTDRPIKGQSPAQHQGIRRRSIWRCGPACWTQSVSRACAASTTRTVNAAPN